MKWEIKCKTTVMSCLSTTWRLHPASVPRCHYDFVMAARVFYFGVSGSQSEGQLMRHLLAWFQHQPPSVLHHKSTRQVCTSTTSDRSRLNLVRICKRAHDHSQFSRLTSLFIRSILLLLDRRQMETCRSRFCCKCQLSAAVGRSGDPDQEDAGLIGPKQAMPDSPSSLSR